MQEIQILPFIQDFIKKVSDGLLASSPTYSLTNRQKLWLSFCLTGILLTNTVCWARFERASYGNWLLPALSWMFRKSKINWELLLKTSIEVILEKYNIKEGTVSVTETDNIGKCEYVSSFEQLHL